MLPDITNKETVSFVNDVVEEGLEYAKNLMMARVHRRVVAKKALVT